MANSVPMSCAGGCGAPGMLGGKGTKTLKDGIWSNNPISIQILGICSALAVTSKLENSLVMGAALIFVTALSNLFVSLLRSVTPRRIRMIAEVAIIATFVIMFDQLLKAFYWDMSRQLGPYVGLIITNCIVMGRAEGFALQNPPVLSFVDGIANGIGYAIILAGVGFFRELAGSGMILGHQVLTSEWYTGNQVFILAPGAFFALGFLVAVFNIAGGSAAQEKKP